MPHYGASTIQAAWDRAIRLQDRGLLTQLLAHEPKFTSLVMLESYLNGRYGAQLMGLEPASVADETQYAVNALENFRRDLGPERRELDLAFAALR